MKYKDFEKLRNPQVDFSRGNVTGCITFVLLAVILFLSVFLYQEHQINKDISELRQRIQVEFAYHQHYKRIAEERDKLIKKYDAERIQIVDISFYTKSRNETDDTPNQSAILTFARPDFTVAASHDLKWMLGHYIYIYGKGVFYVEDLMDARWKRKLDILVDTKKEARHNGVLKNREVVVLGKDLELYYE